MNSLEGHQEYYTEARTGLNRHAAYTNARSFVLADLQALRQHYNGNRMMAGVIVKIKLNGKTLGEASLSGIDLSMYTDNNQDTLEETAFDLTGEAIADAIQYVESIGGDAARLRKLDRAYTRLLARRRAIVAADRRAKHFKGWRDLSQPYQHTRTHWNRKTKDKARKRVTA